MRPYGADFSIMDSGSARPVLGMVGLRFLFAMKFELALIETLY